MTKRTLDFTALSLFIVISLALAWLAYSFGGMDFNVYYAAARVAMRGGNPYDFSQLAPELISTGRFNNPYYYAPWFTWSVIPFALFSYSTARVLWALVHFALWIASLINLSQLVEYPRPGWSKWGVWLLVTFIFAWSAWGAEQVGVLILFLFTLILLAAQKENWKTVGVLLALILFKPNVTALPAALIALWILLRKRTWIHIGTMTAALALLLTVELILDPQFYLPLFDADKAQGLAYTLNASGGLEVKRYTATLRDFLAVYGIQGGAASAIYTIVVLVGLAALGFSLLFSSSLMEFSACAILANFAVMPYALFYDYPALVIPLFYANHALFSRKVVRRAANALIFVALFVGDVIPYRYWMVIILSLFLSLAYFLKKTAASSERYNPK